MVKTEEIEYAHSIPGQGSYYTFRTLVAISRLLVSNSMYQRNKKPEYTSGRKTRVPGYGAPAQVYEIFLTRNQALITHAKQTTSLPTFRCL